MKKIGIDFGTTNSTISFYNNETKSLDCFHMRAGSSDYIPSVVAYKDDVVSIGDSAKKNITKKGYDVYEHFKLRLGDSANTLIEGRKKTPAEVTTAFLGSLLEEYKRNQGIEEIEQIVMTVPETWFREASNRTARENIESIYSNLGYSSDIQFHLESEPVAASGYFCWSYANAKHEEYNGYIVVIDYGGGTLDVTLCSVEDGARIKVLERCGYGEFGISNGCAGVAFDEAVVEKLCERNELDIHRGDKDFIKLCSLFENEKITETKNVSEMMAAYYSDPGIVEGDEIFVIEWKDDEIPVYCEDLAECFSSVNEPVLVESIRQIKQYFETHGVDSSDQERFRVLMVGGFSNFYSVEETIRKEFGSRSGLLDKRFDQAFSYNNKSLAIAKGAALIAQNVITVEHTCTHNIGYIVVQPGKGDRWVDRDVIIIEKGKKLSEASSPIYADKKVQIRLQTGSLRIFLDDGREDGSGRTQAALDQTVGELFPNPEDPDNEYLIGFSVDKNLIPIVHIKDRTGSINRISLYSLLSRLAVREI